MYNRSSSMTTLISSYRRNYMLSSHRRDGLVEWMKEILNHSFVLNAPQTYIESFRFFEELIEEYRAAPENSRLKSFVPTVGKFHTPLLLQKAFEKYDSKYAISQRRHICPSFNELRHILNLAQVMSIGTDLSLISFDGDQTLYTDGGNFEYNAVLANSIISLLKQGVHVAVVTAAGYGLDGGKYAVRLQGLLDSFITEKLSADDVSRFYVFGGECNYLLRGQLTVAGQGSDSVPFDAIESTRSCVQLVPVAESDWQAESLTSPKPAQWPRDQVAQILDVAEATIRSTIAEMRLRAKVLRKPRAVGMYPGGDEMAAHIPVGHGSKKLKREALDETVLRVLDALRTAQPPITIPYCAFNGGRDAWVDIGNKSVAVEVLQAFLGLEAHQCLHVGDQFLSSGNDYAARATCPCIWITSPRETEKILEHVLKYKLGIISSSPSSASLQSAAAMAAGGVDHDQLSLRIAAAGGGQLKDEKTEKPVQRIVGLSPGVSAAGDEMMAAEATRLVPVPTSQGGSREGKSINVYTGEEEILEV